MRPAFNKRAGLEFRPTYTTHNKLTVNQENIPSEKTDFGVGDRSLITTQLNCEAGNLLSFLSYMYQGSGLLEVNRSESRVGHAAYFNPVSKLRKRGALLSLFYTSS